ncbi:hypothetical protein BV25DRAFT_1824917 [Artomyces pyxidatus]|uniref:Uncharacterized protein n=1 Tax=Artomyces pyxidatus TaxID=48021 RepID=A0ACB8T2G1_9AGAM|nr:hypothetical protein BV25DRAFT_1824917 [Artomyces pyxidatus]
MPPSDAPGDIRDLCSYCSKNVGRDNLRKCSRCKLTRYCSKDCQISAWRLHKSSCNATARMLANLASHPVQSSLNDDLTKWLNIWKPLLHKTAPIAFNLTNSPPDCLATQSIVMQIERRPNPPSRAQSFRMIEGGVISNADWLDHMHEEEYKPEHIEMFTNDNRGDDTIRIIVLCGREEDGLTRILYFSLRDKGDSYRRLPPHTAEELAEAWADNMMAAIEEGSTNPAGILSR